MQAPECRPGEFGARWDKGIVGLAGLLREIGRIGFLLREVGEPVTGYVASFEPPAEEAEEFFAASSTNSASVCDTISIA